MASHRQPHADLLHHPDGTHRTTAPDTNGRTLEKFERKIAEHTADGHTHKPGLVAVRGGKVHRAGCPSVAQAEPKRLRHLPDNHWMVLAGSRAGIIAAVRRQYRRNGLREPTDAQATGNLHGCVT